MDVKESRKDRQQANPKSQSYYDSITYPEVTYGYCKKYTCKIKGVLANELCVDCCDQTEDAI